LTGINFAKVFAMQHIIHYFSGKVNISAIAYLMKIRYNIVTIHGLTASGYPLNCNFASPFEEFAAQIGARSHLNHVREEK